MGEGGEEEEVGGCSILLIHCEQCRESVEEAASQRAKSSIRISGVGLNKKLPAFCRRVKSLL